MAVRRNYFKNGTPKPDPADNGSTGAPKVHRGCQTCAHHERSRIEALYCAGVSLDKLAEQFPPLKRDAVFRHCTNHLSDAMKINYLAGPAAIADLANLAAQENRGVIEYLAIVRSILMHAMNTEAAKGNSYATERVAGRLIDVLAAIGKITGEVTELARTSISITNNSAVVMNSPIIAELQTELLTALQPFPDARAAIIALFVRLDERHGQPDTKLIEGKVLQGAAQ